MILYHGSQEIVPRPEFGKGKKTNDYGLGFYCTEVADMAREWAVKEGSDGFINKYEIDIHGLSVLNLASGTYDILHWLVILLENRTFDPLSVLAYDAKRYLIDNYSVDYDKYDIIMGYRADDSYFSFARDFLNGTISHRQLGRAMYLGKLGIQVVLKSPKAFDRIQYISHEKVDSEIWFPRREARDDKARRDYFDVEKNRRKAGDVYITTILDEQILPGDARLEATYESIQ